MKARRIDPCLRLVRNTSETDVRATWARAQAANVTPTRIEVVMPDEAAAGCSLCAGQPCAVPQACQAGDAHSKRPPWLGAHLSSYMVRDLAALCLAIGSILASVVAMAFIVLGH